MLKPRRAPSRFLWMGLGLALAAGLAVAAFVYWRQLDAATPTEAQAEQIVLEQWERTFDAEPQTFEGTLVVKLQPHVTDEPYTWHEQSPLAAWKYTAGDLSPATPDDLEQTRRVRDVTITYFSMQSRGYGEIVVRVAGYSPIMQSRGFNVGGYGVTWRLAKGEAGWEIVAYEDETNWDGIAVP